jgi:altronate hydrolase
MKISTNSTLAKNKPNWIDYNAGQLVDGVDMKTVLEGFIDKIIAIANGEKSRNEANGYSEIAIFKNGVTL